MASTPLGDIPAARHLVPPVPVAAVASNGANARVGQVGPFPHNTRIRRLYFTPTAADQGANAASYRRLTAVNGGSLGTGTVVIGSLNLNASKASLAPASFVVDSTLTLAANDVLVVNQLTVGGTDATGTVLQAGLINGDYEVI